MSWVVTPRKGVEEVWWVTYSLLKRGVMGSIPLERGPFIQTCKRTLGPYETLKGVKGGLGVMLATLS